MITNNPASPTESLLSHQVPDPPGERFRLYFFRILEYYDQPLIYLAQDAAGNPFIALLTHPKYKQPYSDLWTVFPLSPYQYAEWKIEGGDLKELQDNAPWWATAYYYNRIGTNRPMFAEVVPHPISKYPDFYQDTSFSLTPIRFPFFDDVPDTLHPGRLLPGMTRLH